MIIRSMSRKDASFDQLVTYATRDAADVRYQLLHNMTTKPNAAIIAEFEANARLLGKREGGVVVFHEILSIQRSDRVPLDHQKETLRVFALDYLKQRAPGNLALGALHDDHAKHLHYHIVISSNAAGERRRHRLAKADFNQIKLRLEAKMLALHPELDQRVAMNKTARRQLSQRGEALKQRVGRVPQRDRVEASLKAAFAKATSRQDLFDRLTDVHLELYRRGKAVSVIDHESGRKHRLSTLGLDADYAAMIDRLDRVTAVQQVQASVKQQAASIQPMPPQQVQSQSAPIQKSPSLSSAPSSKEADVNLFEALTQGVAAILDAASITPATVEPAKAADQQSDRERIAADRLAEMQERREQQDRDHQQDQSRSRTR